MRRVIIESPYAGKGWCAPLRWWRTWRNVRYARKCVRHALSIGEAPIASHLLYTQRGVLRDGVPAERQWGIKAGLEWQLVAEASVVYIDRGISSGMEQGVAAARAKGMLVEFRSIEDSKHGRALRGARRQSEQHALYMQYLREGGAPIFDHPFELELGPDGQVREVQRARPIAGGYLRKGGRNVYPGQVSERPPAPGPICRR